MDSSKRVSFSIGTPPKPVTPAEVPLTITTQPQDVTCKSGDTVTFSVAVAGGKAPYSYQWKYDTENKNQFANLKPEDGVTGWNTASISDEVWSEDFTYALRYRCVITDAAGKVVVSEIAKPVKLAAVLPEKALTITVQPKDVECAEGDSATFTVAVTGGKAPYTYKWSYKASTLLGYKQLNGGTDEASGFDTAALTVKVSLDALYYQHEYRCTITDANGLSIISDTAKLKAKPVSALAVTTQPRDVEGKIDQSLSFSVAVTGGTEPYTYQWQYTQDGVTYVDLAESHVINGWVLGFASPALTVFMDENDLEMGFGFRCIVTDDLGNTVISDTGYVQYQVPLRISFQTGNVLASVGDQAVFAVAAIGGTEPYSYQWQACRGASGIWSNVTSAVSGYNTDAIMFTATEALLDASMEYRCVVTDADGNTAISSGMKLSKKLTIVKALSITTQPANQLKKIGATATYSVAVTGGKAPYTYQWQVLAKSIVGWKPVTAFDGYNTDTMRFTVTAEIVKELPKFRCVIKDSNGNTVTSESATLVLAIGR